MGAQNEERREQTFSATEENTANAEPMPSLQTKRSSRSFSERMGDAGYIPGRRYDAVKNVFLAYKTQERKPRAVKSRIARSGETFYSGRKVFAKLCLVGGYLRLFLALDPKKYNAEKYHHKDYSEVVRYAKFPFMIKLSSDRQVRYAQELIASLLEESGFIRDENYVESDQANIFKKPRRRRAEPQTEEGALFVPLASAADAEIAAGMLSGEFSGGEDAEEDIGEPEAIDVKLPKRGRVVNKQGERIGKIRRRGWYDNDDEFQGEFVKEQTNVFVYRDETRTGYVDKNNNILTLSNKYVATIRRWTLLFLVLLLVFLLILTAVTGILVAYFLTRTETPEYAPVLFIASEDGVSWEDTENLPVFRNELFGDSKIAPGMSGSYRFVFENQNQNKLTYTLLFEEENDHGIELVYRLKRDGAYIAGRESFVGVQGLGIEQLTIEAESSTVFELEWMWRHNDEKDTAAGENSAFYTLLIHLTAQVSEPV